VRGTEVNPLSVREAARLASEDIVDQVERFREKVQRKEHTYDDVRAIKEGERPL